MGAILIIDDDLDSRVLLREILSFEGLDCRECESGGEALSLLINSRQEFALIILDIRLPDINGIDVLKKIRKAGINIPVVGLSAIHPKSLKIKCSKEGFVDFLFKPISLDKVIQLSRSIL